MTEVILYRSIVVTFIIMYYLIYTSTAEPEVDEVELYDILNRSVKNNKELDITGMLVYHDGSFIQLLEGDRERVHSIYRKIKNDARHRNVIKLSSGEHEDRCFPNWSMALEVVHEKTFSEISAFRSLDSSDLFFDELNQNHVGLKLIRYFYSINQR